MFTFDGRLYAINDSTGRFFRAWDPPSRTWQRAAGLAGPLASSADGLVRLGDGWLRFVGGRVEFNGRTILAPPSVGRYNHFYYAQGRLFFYHTLKEDPGGFTRLYACPWTPESEGPVNLARAEVLTTPVAGEVSWAFGQLGRQVITVSNLGGVYVYDGKSWRVLGDPSPGVSYQVYSAGSTILIPTSTSTSRCAASIVLFG